MIKIITILIIIATAGCTSPDGTVAYFGIDGPHPACGTIWDDLSPVRVIRNAFFAPRAIHQYSNRLSRK